MLRLIRFLIFPPCLIVFSACNPAPQPDAQVPQADSLEAELKKHKVEVLAFTAPWCHVCKDVPPMFQHLKQEVPNLACRDVNIDSSEQEDLDLYIKYKGDGLPYFIFLVDGKEVGRLRGLASKSDTAKILRDTLSKELLNK